MSPNVIFLSAPLAEIYQSGSRDTLISRDVSKKVRKEGLHILGAPGPSGSSVRFMQSRFVALHYARRKLLRALPPKAGGIEMGLAKGEQDRNATRDSENGSQGKVQRISAA